MALARPQVVSPMLQGKASLALPCWAGAVPSHGSALAKKGSSTFSLGHAPPLLLPLQLPHTPIHLKTPEKEAEEQTRGKEPRDGDRSALCKFQIDNPETNEK